MNCCTFAKEHSGKWVTLASPGVPINEQVKAFRAMQGPRTHPTYELVQMWDEHTGKVRSIKFGQPELEAPKQAAQTPPSKAPDIKADNNAKGKK